MVEVIYLPEGLFSTTANKFGAFQELGCKSGEFIGKMQGANFLPIAEAKL